MGLALFVYTLRHRRHVAGLGVHSELTRIFTSSVKASLSKYWKLDSHTVKYIQAHLSNSLMREPRGWHSCLSELRGTGAQGQLGGER